LLPVELLSLEAGLADQGVLLSWTTGNEYNSAGFAIEKSTDGANFDAIGWMESQGAGSTYNFLDKQSAPGMNYYRLRQIDIDGASSLSRVVSVVMPAPLTLASAEVFTMQGARVMAISNTATLQSSLSELPAGVYLARYYYSDGSVRTERLFRSDLPN
jgi:hypothetical protein